MKRNTEDEESSQKKAKTDGEKELDDADDSRPEIGTEVVFHGGESTLNVFSAMRSQVLMALSEGGMQYLLAGARANVGISSGRYFYEVKILETLNPAEAVQGWGPQPRQVARVGFSTSEAPLLLADSEECAYFEADGTFVSGKMRQKVGLNFARDQVLGILLNLDSSSPLANTISVFRDGQRVAQPQPLPEALKGKTLFPHVTFRHVSLQVNMGKEPLKPLPFKCRMIQSAAKADVEETPDPSLAGKFEVVLPVCIPDEGTFDWLDFYLQKQPNYVELSDRKIQDWASRSGMAKPRQGANSSNDKPSFAYNVPSMDDGSIQRVIKSIAPVVPRNYVVMEVKSNLVKEERLETLKHFNTPNFKKVALVIMGEPDLDFKQKSYTSLLVEKQSRIDFEWQSKKTAAKRQKELAEMRRKADELRRKKLEEAKKKQEGDEKEEEMKEEEIKKEEVKEELNEDDGLGDEPPKAELTDEEKKKVFRTKPLSDVLPTTLGRFLDRFTLPDKSEGFDEVKFLWDPATKCQEYLRTWILEAKRNTPIEDLQPSQEFTTKYTAWQKQQLEWQQKQNFWKAKPKGPDGKASEIRLNMDMFDVQDINDIHDGEPLYAHFEPADWALLQLRYELYLLQDAFKKDVTDPDRSAIPEAHLSFYYNKYFSKQLNPGVFSLKNNSELLQMIKDVVTLSGQPPVLTSQLDAETSVDSPDIFVKFTEEARRERQRRAEAGDQKCMLRYTPPARQTPPPPRPAAMQWQSAIRPPRPQWQGGGATWNRW